ncbi:hypothetical protein [Caloramator sp. Dgby_cultured_2]
MWLASFLDEFVVDLPDKVASLVISFLIYKGLPKSLINLYSSDDEIERL